MLKINGMQSLLFACDNVNLKHYAGAYRQLVVGASASEARDVQVRC
jgi:hypothetical protein